MKTIIVTGSSGFIGQRFCRFNPDKHKVIACDSSALPYTVDNCISVQVNITDNYAVKTVCDNYSPDMVIHSAGIAHQKIKSIDSEEYQRVNSLATENLAKAAITVNPNVHFIFLSSISVYGEDKNRVAVSEMSECNPSSDYANSKLDAERRLIKLYDSGELKKLDILRLSPVYDSEWSLNLDRRVFAPNKMAYIKFGTGLQEMSAVSRQNLVDFIAFRLKQEEDNKNDKSFCNILNVCDEKPYKFKEMIRVFKQSKYHPNRLVVRVPLSLVWITTRLAGIVLKNKRQWLHSCYDKLAYD